MPDEYDCYAHDDDADPTGLCPVCGEVSDGGVCGDCESLSRIIEQLCEHADAESTADRLHDRPCGHCGDPCSDGCCDACRSQMVNA